MTLVATARAFVVVLGRRPDADGAELVRAAAVEGALLRLLVVGYPVTPEQRAVETAAMTEADRLGARLDVRLVLSGSALRAELEPGADVRVVAEPREARRLQRALRSA